MKKGSFVVSVLLVIACAKAYASTDINGLFDGRSAGMGGTGVAFIDSAGAIPINPALLDQIGKLTISLDLFGIVAQPEGPYTVYHLDSSGQHYANYETVRSPATGAVLPFLGAAYRLFDRVVIGIAAYPVLGMGATAKYRPAPDELPQVEAKVDASLGFVEGAVPISVRLLDNLSLGVMWRVSYMTQTANTPVNLRGPPAGVLLNQNRTAVANADLEVSGINFAGFQVGLLYKALPNLRFGVTYRSKVVVDGTGTTTNSLSGALDTRTSFSNPHTFRGGVAWSILNDKLLLAADFKYLMYGEAFENLKIVTLMKNGMESTKVQPLHWKDSFVGQFGAEYTLSDMFRVRAGYIILNSATPEAYALAYFAPPGIQNLVSAGLGIKAIDSLNVDLAAAYLVLQSQVNTATQYNSGVGLYGSHAAEFSVSATYHM